MISMTVICQECDREFDTQRGLSLHKTQTHAETETVTCEQCKQEFDSKRGIKIHRQHTNGDCSELNGTHCPECDETFDGTWGVYLHWRQTHDGECPIEYDHPVEGMSLTFSDTRNEKLSESLKEYYENHTVEREPLSEATKEKISRAHTGKTLSEEHKQKISDSLKGRESPMKGYTFSATQRRRLSESLTGVMAGEDHPNWKGGASERRYSSLFTASRKAARWRDDETCQYCRDSTKDVEVHHCVPIRTFDNPEIGDQLANLICLCVPCHRRHEDDLKDPSLKDRLHEYYVNGAAKYSLNDLQ